MTSTICQCKVYNIGLFFWKSYRKFMDIYLTLMYVRGVTIEETRFPMKAVSKRTGLTPDVIRVWERRYGAINPNRTATNRRLFNEEEVRRLILLKRVVEAGHGIGRVARLPDGKLAELSDSSNFHERHMTPDRVDMPGDGLAAELLEASLKAVRALELEALVPVLNRGLLTLSRPVLLENLILPLLREVGEAWHDGDLRIAHEHMTSHVVRTFLGDLLLKTNVPSSSPHVVIATPAGQKHELGALAAALMAAGDGWKTTYLGADLPAEEIAAAALHNHARAVCLSLVYPGDDSGLATELVRLHSFLSKDIALGIGGTAAGSYRYTLESIGAVSLADIGSMRMFLATLREPKP